MQNPPGHIFVYTYVRTPSATAARRSNVFLHHQEGFCVINTRFQVKLPIGIRAWKTTKTKPLLKASSSKKTKITFLRNDRLQTHSRLREQRYMRQCDRCTFSAIAVFLASSPSTTAQQTRLRPGAKPHPAPVMLLLCGHGILNPTRLFAFTRHVAVSRQGRSMGRTIVFV